MYRIHSDAVVILDVYEKKTRKIRDKQQNYYLNLSGNKRAIRHIGFETNWWKSFVNA